MITENQYNALKSILPDEFAKDVSVRLNKKGLLPKRATVYNSNIIRKVFRGLQEDINVELEIFRYRDAILKKRLELNTRDIGNQIPIPENNRTKNQ